MDTPTTLLEAARFFANEETCIKYVAALRWPEGPVCPRCEGKAHSWLSTRKIWKCKGCQKQFSIKGGTIFEDSPIPLAKWLIAIWKIVNAKNSCSSWELHRDLGITQKTAWFMAQRIRIALHVGSFDKKLHRRESPEHAPRNPEGQRERGCGKGGCHGLAWDAENREMLWKQPGEPL